MSHIYYSNTLSALHYSEKHNQSQLCQFSFALDQEFSVYIVCEVAAYVKSFYLCKKKGDPLCKINFYIVFEHKCVLEVCVNN